MVTVNGSSKAALEATLPPQNVISNSLPASLKKHAASDITIGYAAASEAAAIAKIGTDTFTIAFGHSVSAQDLADFLATTYSTASVQRDMQNPRVVTWVARDSTSKVLGFVQLVRGLSEPCIPGDAATHAELRRLYVDATAHGRGIGSKLMAAVEAQARAEGFKQLWLTVWEFNPNAQRLYERLGYEKVGAMGFATGKCVQTDFVLCKAL
jgi:ribosomal protein S18 acetylase RimI-like enzyme